MEGKLIVASGFKRSTLTVPALPQLQVFTDMLESENVTPFVIALGTPNETGPLVANVIGLFDIPDGIGGTVPAASLSVSSPFTLYGLLTNGELIALSPVVVPCCSVL